MKDGRQVPDRIAWDSVAESPWSNVVVCERMVKEGLRKQVTCVENVNMLLKQD